MIARRGRATRTIEHGEVHAVARRQFCARASARYSFSVAVAIARGLAVDSERRRYGWPRNRRTLAITGAAVVVVSPRSHWLPDL